MQSGNTPATLLVGALVVAMAAGCSAMLEKQGELLAARDMGFAKGYCDGLGYGEGSPQRAECLAAVIGRLGSQGRSGSPATMQGTGPDGLPGIPMYPESACIGAVVNGECKGTILHPGPPPKRCYGNVVNGKCIGPEF